MTTKSGYRVFYTDDCWPYAYWLSPNCGCDGAAAFTQAQVDAVYLTHSIIIVRYVKIGDERLSTPH